MVNPAERKEAPDPANGSGPFLFQSESITQPVRSAYHRQGLRSKTRGPGPFGPGPRPTALGAERICLGCANRRLISPESNGIREPLRLLCAVTLPTNSSPVDPR